MASKSNIFCPQCHTEMKFKKMIGICAELECPECDNLLHCLAGFGYPRYRKKNVKEVQEKYYCSECGRYHYYGKIYEEHKKFKKEMEDSKDE